MRRGWSVVTVALMINAASTGLACAWNPQDCDVRGLKLGMPLSQAKAILKTDQEPRSDGYLALKVDEVDYVLHFTSANLGAQLYELTVTQPFDRSLTIDAVEKAAVEKYGKPNDVVRFGGSGVGAVAASYGSDHFTKLLYGVKKADTDLGHGSDEAQLATLIARAKITHLILEISSNRTKSTLYDAALYQKQRAQWDMEKQKAQQAAEEQQKEKAKAIKF